MKSMPYWFAVAAIAAICTGIAFGWWRKAMSFFDEYERDDESNVDAFGERKERGTDVEPVAKAKR